MKRYLLYFLIPILYNCQFQMSNGAHINQREIQFEDKNHYPFSLTKEAFLVIDSQQKMDDVYKIIHQHSIGNRLSPIPIVSDNDIYIVIHPKVTNDNDISIDSIRLQKNILYVYIKEFDNPNISHLTKDSTHVLIKLNEKITFKNIIIKYDHK